MATLKERTAAKKAIEASGQKFTLDNMNKYMASQPQTTADAPSAEPLTFGNTLTEQTETSSPATFGENLAQNTATQADPATRTQQMDTSTIGTPDAPVSGGAINFDDGQGNLTSASGEQVYTAGETAWSLSKPDKAALEAYGNLLGSTRTAVQGYQKTLDKSIKSYEKSFSELSTIVADQGTQFNEAMMAMAEQGKEVDLNNAGLMTEIEEAMKSGEQVDFEKILGNYPVEETVSKVGGVDIGTPDDPKSGGRLNFDDTPSPDASAAGAQTKDQILDGLVSATGKDNLSADEWKALQAQADKQMAEQGDSNEVTQSPSVVDVNTTPDVEVPTSELVGQTMDGIKDVSQQSLFSALQGAGYDLNELSSAEALQVMVAQQQIDIANDPAMATYLNGQKILIDKTYQDTIDTYNEDVEGITAIINGEALVPSSYDQLAAAVYKQQSDFSKESIDNEVKYRTEQYNAQMGVEREKRGRLEGYLKAKLTAGGMSDSSAGLASMAIQVNAADARLSMAESEHMYALSGLNQQSRKIMTDYANNIVKIGLDADAKKGTAMQTHADSISKIDKELITNSIEQRGLKMAAISQFSEVMLDIDKNKKEQARYEEEQQYKKTKDAVDQAYKLSGMTGSVYAVGDGGEIIDTGVSTLATRKWESSNALSYMKYAQDIDNDSYDKAFDLIDRGVDSASVERMLNMDPGSMSQMKSKDEMKAAVTAAQTSRETDFFINGDKYASTGGAIANCYEDGVQGGQCGTFMHKIYNIPSMGDSLQSKINTMTQPGVGPATGNIVIFDEGTAYGHVASINEDDPVNRRFKLTESNYPSGEKVRNDRWISYDDPKIRGFGVQELKPELKGLIQTSQDSELDKFVERAATNSIADARRDLKEAIGGYSTSAKAEILNRFEDRVNETPKFDLDAAGFSGNLGLDSALSIGNQAFGYTGKSIYETEQANKGKGSSQTTEDFAAELRGLASGGTASAATGSGEFDEPIQR